MLVDGRSSPTNSLSNRDPSRRMPDSPELVSTKLLNAMTKSRRRSIQGEAITVCWLDALFLFLSTPPDEIQVSAGCLSCIRPGQKSGGDGASQSRRLASVEQLGDHRP